MSTVSVTQFFGELPLADNDKLPPGYATGAVNCDFSTGVLQGVKGETEVALGSGGSVVGWEYATEFRSDDPFVTAMGGALGKTEQETADLVQFASGL